MRYVGWSGLPQVFDSRNEEWKAERELSRGQQGRFGEGETQDPDEPDCDRELGPHYRHAERIRGSGAELSIGSFAGFNLSAADTYMRGPEIVLKGAATHAAKVSNSAHGTIQSVEYTN